jgi:hypothetical protein
MISISPLVDPDGVDGTFGLMSANYGGFQWDNFGFDSTPPAKTGYRNGVVSNFTTLFSANGASAGFSRDRLFDLNRIYVDCCI